MACIFALEPPRRRLVVLALVCALAPASVSSQEFLASLAEAEEKLIEEITLANDLLDEFDPPRFKIESVSATLSIVDESSIGGGIKVPLIGGGEANLIRGRMSKETYFYVPRDELGVEGQALGLDEFISRTHRNLAERNAEHPVLLTKASKTVKFYLQRRADGKLEILDAVSVGSSIEQESSHEVTFNFCLVEDQAVCVE